ncbi:MULTISPECIES: TolC family protein [unclassified Mucilaginibacter]|uniref:TolC family protein n=1 Tax=unclassified Mucilaginibacter TaxID=2617802 RepID=UPI00138C9307|nr:MULTISPECIES: TolC family protein [unclassified Mucilaginibacter]MBB5394312.1 outer membrane protein [Mucilaginibacter sp. AK015]QHS57274.1 TolC family protein [Mucilaginibacter sp. 14171R-50]
MRYFKFLLFSLITIAPALAHSQAVDSVLTLQQCIDIAVKNNLDVKKSELQLQVAKVDKNQAKENLLPAISAQVDHGISNGRSLNQVDYTYVNASTKFASYSANADLTLFSGLQNLNRIKQTSLAYKAGEMDLQQAKDAITINTITAYLQVLNNTEALAQVQNQVEVSKKQLDRLDILEKQGANKQPNDFYDLKGTYADNQVTYVNAKAVLQTSKLNLLQILNIPYRPDIKFEKLTGAEILRQNGTSDEIYQTALAQLAYVKAATLRRQSAEKGVAAAKGALYPTISLFGGLNTNYSSAAKINDVAIPYGDQFKNNFYNQFGVSVRIPILNYFQNRNKVTLAKIDLQNYKYVEENTKIKLRQDVEQAYLNMSNALERYKALQEQVKAYAESFRIAEIRFNAGVLTSVDYVLAKNYLDRANLNLINARYDCYIYNKILDYYQGRLSL